MAIRLGGILVRLDLYRIGRSCLVVCAVLATAATACASNARSDGDKVFVNEMPVLTLRNGGSAILTRRAANIAARLAKLDKTSPLALSVHDGLTKIVSGDETVLSVSQDEAQAQEQSPEMLAATWLANIRAALQLPPIQFEKPGAKLPVGGKVQIMVVGSEVDRCSLENSNPSVAAAFHSHNILYLRGVASGHSTVTLKGPTASEQVSVDVLPYAAVFPQTIDVVVTGDPASKETVKGAVDGAIRTKLPCQPGTELQFSAPDVSSLPIEGTVEYSATVQANSTEAFPAEGKVTVQVHNVPLARKEESALWYSNDPEDVKQPGNLFGARLMASEAVRLLYHHMNATDYPLVFAVRVLNNSDKPAQIQIIPGDSKPDLNPVLAGYTAGDQFLRNWIANSGEVVTIPPRSELPISLRQAGSKQTISGLCYVRLLGGGPDELLVRVDAFETGQVSADLSPGFKSSKPWHMVGTQKMSEKEADIDFSREVYPKPFKQQDVSYRVGGKFGFIQIGQKPIESEDEKAKLDGNFGVVYTIHVNVVNPTSTAADVVVDFESNAGYSGGLFLVDGRLIRTHLLQPKEGVEIDRVHVEPGETRPITILTCPLSGGSYPATIAVMPLDPSALMRDASKG